MRMLALTPGPRAGGDGRAETPAAGRGNAAASARHSAPERTVPCSRLCYSCLAVITLNSIIVQVHGLPEAVQRADPR